MKRKNFIRSSIGVLTASYLPPLPKFAPDSGETLFIAPAFLKTGTLLGSLPRLVILPVMRSGLLFKKWKAGVIK
jgi:hypothetical protein